jgi:hypothetical protein
VRNREREKTDLIEREKKNRIRIDARFASVSFSALFVTSAPREFRQFLSPPIYYPDSQMVHERINVFSVAGQVQLTIGFFQKNKN